MNQVELLDALNNPADVSTDDLATGMHLCFKNASALLADARLLLASSPARSFALAVLAMEETAKIFLLYELAIESLAEKVPGRKVQKELRSHAKGGVDSPRALTAVREALRKLLHRRNGQTRDE